MDQLGVVGGDGLPVPRQPPPVSEGGVPALLDTGVHALCGGGVDHGGDG